jgi:2-keto-4-pentenoate hydratase/2-oxohepta-3-ene-1,7-dioic acid hydratase in catechol pathway
MKIIRFRYDSSIHHGQLLDDGAALLIEGDIFGSHRVTDKFRVDKLLSPLIPTDILCIGLNYRKHAEESQSQIPVNPMLFIKASNTLNNPGDPIIVPKLSDKVDFENELAIVIGKQAKHVSREDALKYVFGYTIANDVSARDWQRDKNLGGGQFARGKSFDTFCPIGPFILTSDEVPNPNDLKIKTTLNGQVMQDYTTKDMIFDVPTLIASLSSTMTLRPGSIILTGTPHGVGFARTPPVFLKPGDTITCEIEKLGKLENPVIAEK